MAADPTTIAPPGRDALRSPDLAWPTVLLATTTFSLWVAVGCLAAQDVLPLWVACLANSVLAYISFTPQHDAVHGSVSKAHPGSTDSWGESAAFHCFRRFPPFAGCIWRTTSTPTTRTTILTSGAGRGRGTCSPFAG